MHPTQLVVFDIGRVMIALVSGWPEACERVGIPCPAEIDSEQTRARFHQVVYLHEVGKIDAAEYLKRAAEVTGVTPQNVRDVMTAWLRDPYPGLDQLIDDIHAAGMKTACLSNTSGMHWPVLVERLNLGRLHYRFASHIVGAFKPEPAIYQALEQETGIDPFNIMFFDDIEVNCIGARERGWQAHQIIHPGDPVAQMRTHLRVPLRGAAR